MSSTSALTSDRMLKKVSNFVLSRTSPCGRASEGARLGAPGVGGRNGEAFLSILWLNSSSLKCNHAILSVPRTRL